MLIYKGPNKYSIILPTWLINHSKQYLNLFMCSQEHFQDTIWKHWFLISNQKVQIISFWKTIFLPLMIRSRSKRLKRVNLEFVKPSLKLFCQICFIIVATQSCKTLKSSYYTTKILIWHKIEFFAWEFTKMGKTWHTCQMHRRM